MSWSEPIHHGYPSRTPSGLFPSRPSRPTYREPHPVRPGAVAAGLGAGTLWMLLFGLLGTASVRAYGWWTILAGAVAWVVTAVLTRYGDRGVAVGAAIAVACAWAVAGIVLVAAWVAGDGWVLW